jgi:hypothetical protein
MWTELISTLLPDAEFRSPAEDEALHQVEHRLDWPLPEDLRSLLREADGVLGAGAVDVIWPAERIAEDNHEFRHQEAFAELYEPFDELLFFADNGGGDQFAYTRNPQDGIMVWDHETDERRKVADDLADYLRRRLPSDGDVWYRWEDYGMEGPE